MQETLITLALQATAVIFAAMLVFNLFVGITVVLIALYEQLAGKRDV